MSRALIIEDEPFADFQKISLARQGIDAIITPRLSSDRELLEFYFSLDDAVLATMVLVLIDQGYLPELAAPTIQRIRQLSPEALILERSGAPRRAIFPETNAVVFDTNIFAMLLGRFADTAPNQVIFLAKLRYYANEAFFFAQVSDQNAEVEDTTSLQDTKSLWNKLLSNIYFNKIIELLEVEQRYFANLFRSADEIEKREILHNCFNLIYLLSLNLDPEQLNGFRRLKNLIQK